jgi:hypothetical protein
LFSGARPSAEVFALLAAQGGANLAIPAKATDETALVA